MAESLLFFPHLFEKLTVNWVRRSLWENISSHRETEDWQPTKKKV